MSSITGPVEVLAWHFPSAGAAIAALAMLDHFRDDPSVRVLDLLIGTQEDDEISYLEIDSDGSSRVGVIELPDHGRGLIAHEDVNSLAAALEIEEGSAVLVVALEHLWADHLGTAMQAAGGASAFDGFVAQSTINHIIHAASMKAGA